MTGFLSISDHHVAKELGADLVRKTFPDDIPYEWFVIFRNAGWSPVPVAPDEATVKPEATAQAEREALNAQLEAMDFADYRAAREAGWSPGSPLPSVTGEP